jgi:hypothetical protein
MGKNCIFLLAFPATWSKLHPNYNFLFPSKAVRQKVCPIYAQERVCGRSLMIFSGIKKTKAGLGISSAFS